MKLRMFIDDAWLGKHHACGGQRERFRSLFPNGLVVPKGENARWCLFTFLGFLGLNVDWLARRMEGVEYRPYRWGLNAVEGFDCDQTVRYLKEGAAEFWDAQYQALRRAERANRRKLAARGRR